MRVRKVLVLSGLQIYPPESGGMLRTSGLIAALVARGFDVTVYSMVGRKKDYLAGKPSGTITIHERLNEYVDRGRIWAAFQFLAYRFRLPPFWIGLTLSMRTPAALRKLLATCDAVIIDFPFLYPAARKVAKPVALNTHNVEADLCKTPWIKRLVAALERRAVRAVQQVFCCSEDDRAHFAKMAGAGRVSVVPNGIDPARFAGIAPEREPLRKALGYSEQDRVLLFTASSFAPNVEALSWLEGFVATHQALLAEKNLQFLVVGSVCKQAFVRPRLRVVGTVERIEPYFAAADIAYNGVFRGSGTNVKVAEYLVAGLPILTSTTGTRGYSLVDGEDCITFTPDTLASTIDRNPLLSSPSALKAMAKRAYERNRHIVDMNWCAEPLVEWLRRAQ